MSNRIQISFLIGIFLISCGSDQDVEKPATYKEEVIPEKLSFN